MRIGRHHVFLRQIRLAQWRTYRLDWYPDGVSYSRPKGNSIVLGTVVREPEGWIAYNNGRHPMCEPNYFRIVAVMELVRLQAGP